jgi:hypothetical protein
MVTQKKPFHPKATITTTTVECNNNQQIMWDKTNFILLTQPYNNKCQMQQQFSSSCSDNVMIVIFPAFWANFDLATPTTFV